MIENESGRYDTDYESTAYFVPLFRFYTLTLIYMTGCDLDGGGVFRDSYVVKQ
jgi:predicted alternative tryptophan synthase beta-subunit